MARFTTEQVQAMMEVLEQHFHQPVLPVERYCEALRAWANAVEEAVERDPTNEELKGKNERIRAVRLDISKSNMLYRLLYLGEPVRTEMCPVHKGRWSGCVGPEQECPHCMSGSDVTGWKVPSAEDRANAMQKAFETVYGPPSKPTLVYLGSTLLDSPGMAAPDKRPFIYTVTAIDVQHEHPNPRCWGWFESMEQAEELLYKDYGDIHEGGTNKFAVIEKCESGICPSTYKSEDRWYRFIPVDGQDFKYTVERLEAQPEELGGGIGWSLG
jgi:hypothetical protein